MLEATRELMGMIVRRRSCRAFSPGALDGVDLDAMEEAAAGVPTIHGREAGEAFVVRDPRRAEELGRALLSGWASKVNLWLRRRPPPAYVVCTGDPGVSPVRSGVHLYNVDAAMAGEAAVLEATARGLGSVWMAAIGEREVVSCLGLAPGRRVLAVVGIGRPGSGTWDGITQRALSGKRRPLAQVAYRDRFGRPLDGGGPDPGRRRDAAALWPGGGDPARPLVPPPSAAFGGRPRAEEIRAMLEASRWAPNAENAQIGRWIVVEDPGRIARVLEAAGAPGAMGAGEFTLIAGAAAPALVSHRTREQPFAFIDVPIAMVHQIAVAASCGHGWNLLVDVAEDGARGALGIPGDHRLVGLLLVGRRTGGDGGGWQQMMERRPR